MAVILITPPAAEPITTAEAKTHLRVEVTADDPFIDTLVATAREHAEMFTRKVFITQTWDLKLDSFPGAHTAFNRHHETFGGVFLHHFDSRETLDLETIHVPKPPLQSVTSIMYVDEDGVTQTLPTADFDVDTDSVPARITPSFGNAWPSTRAVYNAVTVRFVAGFGAAGSDVPASIIAAMQLLIGHWYEHREAVVENSSVMSVPRTYETLLWGNRVLALDDI